MILNFGKYKDRNIDDIVKEDPNYFKFLMMEDWFRINYKDIHERLQELITDTSIYMPWGKYKFMSLESIVKKDAPYINWLVKNEYVQTQCKDILKASIKILEELNAESKKVSFSDEEIIVGVSYFE